MSGGRERARPQSRRTQPPIIDLEARSNNEPVTPVDVHVMSVEKAPKAPEEYADPLVGDGTGEPLGILGPMSNTGSLPVLAGTVAAIEEEKRMTITHTTAEQRRDDLEHELRALEAWWRNLTDKDIGETLPKAIEYGASDLDLMGQGVRMLQGDRWEGGDAGESRAVGQELAILFYLQGKIARALSAASLGQRCSGDTIKDIRIYAVMLQKVRETGSWVN